MVLVANDLPCTVEGRFKSCPPDGVEMKVLLEYVVLHFPSDGDMTDETRGGVLVLRQLGTFTGAEDCIEVPAKQLTSTYHGMATMKRAIIDTQKGVPGTFHTHLRARVTCNGAQTARSVSVYSSELYECGTRNLRRISDLNG